MELVELVELVDEDVVVAPVALSVVIVSCLTNGSLVMEVTASVQICETSVSRVFTVASFSLTALPLVRSATSSVRSVTVFLKVSIDTSRTEHAFLLSSIFFSTIFFSDSILVPLS